MPPEADIAEQQRQLSALAETSLVMARKLQAACCATDDTRDMCRLAEAYAKVGKCMRMAIALSMRLRRGERLAPVRQDRELDLEADFDDFEDDFDEERLETEQLFDRLPRGPLPVQIAAIARTLGAAAKALPEPLAAEYRTRCDAIVAEATATIPEPHLRRPDTGAVLLLDRPTRARGPPWRD